MRLHRWLRQQSILDVLKLYTNEEPISVANYMKTCMTSLDKSYYASPSIDPLKDFVTSPEISQVFGELIGVWFSLSPTKSTRNYRICELGPGRGTLMADVLRSMNRLKQVNIEQVALVESSKKLQEIQRQRISHPNITWLEDVKHAFKVLNNSPQPTLFVLHEFLDALPVHQFRKVENNWCEVMVTQKPKSAIIKKEEIDENFTTVVSKEPTTYSQTLPIISPRFMNLKNNAQIEISPASMEVVEAISSYINSNGGAALLIDYGPAEVVPVNTLRGIKNNKIVSPFSDPGNVDLSCDVDFGMLKELAQTKGLQVLGPVEQGDWLQEMGIGLRSRQLYEKAKDEKTRNDILMSYKRLVDKNVDSMGKIYKFMALLPQAATDYPGFGVKSSNLK